MKKLILATAILFSVTAQAHLHSTTAQEKALCSHYFPRDKMNTAWHECVQIFRKEVDAERFFQLGMLIAPVAPHEGREWLKKAAALNHAEAMYVLGHSDELLHNQESAFFWYEQAAHLNHPLAQFHTGQMLFEGRGTRQNTHLAFKWFLCASRAGVPEAQFALAQRYEFGEGVRKDCLISLTWYKRAADAGYLPAYIRLGDIYYYGQFGHQDYPKAAMYYHKAALLHDPYAAYQYGAMLAGAIGVQHNSKQAFYWLKIAADQEYIPAASLLGRLYYSSHEQKNYHFAYIYLQRAAFKGDEYALLTLGKMYRHGQGVPQDFKQAAYYFKKAAQCGNAQGQALLGLSYQQGLGVPKNYRMAASLYHQAAAQGNFMSQYNLSGLYYHGRGVPRRRVEAYAYANLSATQGLDEAKEARMLRGNFLTENELIRGQEMALELN